MNKKLLAIAISVAATLPVAAQADGPVIYGKVNLSLDSVTDSVTNRLDSDLDNNGAGNTAASDEGWVLRNNASRLGVKGDAATSLDGVKVVYQIEVGATLDGEGGPFSQRDSFGGIKGDFGTLRLGVMDTPLKKAQGKVDLFNDTAADITSHIAGENRMTNLVYYSSPKIADGLTINLGFQPGENQDDPDATQPATSTLQGPADSSSVSAVWESEGIYAALAMDQMMKNGSNGGAELAKGDWLDATRIVLGYSADAFSAGFLYQVAEESFNVGGNADEDTSMLLNGSFKTGAVTLKAEYAMTEGDDGTAGNSDTEVTQLALGVDYELAKSTTLYAFYSTLEADDGVAGNDDNYDVLAFGMDHKF